MIPDRETLRHFCDAIDQHLHSCEQAFMLYRTEKDPYRRRDHMESFLYYKKKADQAMKQLVGEQED